MPPSRWTFTSESVSEGHPDKLSDAISDAVLDACLELDPNARVACETLCSTNILVLAGEIGLSEGIKAPDYAAIARKTAVRIGYDHEAKGLNGHSPHSIFSSVLSTPVKCRSDWTRKALTSLVALIPVGLVTKA